MRNSWLEKQQWPVFVLPFLVFMLVGSFEPIPPHKDDATGKMVESPGAIDLGLTYKNYPLVYTAKIGLTILTMLVVWPGYRQYPFVIHPLAIGVGIVGGLVWIGLSSLKIEEGLLAKAPNEWLQSLGKRAAFNPLEEMQDNPAWAYGFLAIRLFGLVFIIALIEEWFLRGFVMRFAMDDQWWTVGYDRFHKAALVVVTLFGVVSHPVEAIAAAVWFSGISWLMLRTKSLWACVVAHAITNLMLGIYVIATGDWRLM